MLTNTGRALATLAGQIILVVAALVVGVRFLAPRRLDTPMDEPALAVRAAQAALAYGRTHKSFRDLDPARLIIALPVGAGLAVEPGDSTAVVEIRTHTGRCRIELALSDTVPRRPDCRE